MTTTNDVSGSFSEVNTTVETSTEPQWACLTHYFADEHVQVVNKMFVYVSCCFVVIGLIGNALSMLVFLSPEMRNISSNIYLSVLSISDSAYLISVFLSDILTDIRCVHYREKRFDFENNFDWTCKLLQLLMDLFADYSPCLILAFTFERYLACYHAVKFRETRNTLRARIFCLTIFILIFVSICPQHMYHIGLTRDSCGVLPQYDNIFSMFWAIEVSLYRIIPVLIVASLNVLIGVKIWYLHKNKPSRKSLHPQQHEMTSLANTSETCKERKKRAKATSDERHIQLTVMLMVVSSTYILLYFPVLIHFVMWHFQRRGFHPFSYEAGVIFEKISSMLYIAGFAINFFLYTLSCKVFRDQLFYVLTSRQSRAEHSTTHKGDASSGQNALNGVTDHDNRKTSQTQL